MYVVNLSLNGNIIGKLQKGETVKIISELMIGLKLLTMGNPVGYQSQYIQENNSEETVNT